MAYTEASGSINLSQYRALVRSKLCAVAALEEDWEEARARALQAAALRARWYCSSPLPSTSTTRWRRC